MSGKIQRDVMVKFRATPEEYDLIQAKAALAGIDNLSAYIRKMCIDGYVVKLELPELKEMVSLLKRSSNNLNQIARRVNATNRIYAEDIEDLSRQQHQVWKCANELLQKLSAVS